MTSAYPGSLDVFATDKTDQTQAVGDHAQHHNDLADAVNKIEAELGPAPSGDLATVRASLHHHFSPAYNALKGWSWPPEISASNASPVAGIVILSRLQIVSSGTLSTITVMCTVAGSGGSPANIWLGTYDTAGTLIGKTANQASSFGSTGVKTFALTAEAGQSLAVAEGGYVFGAIVVGTHSSTPFQIQRAAAGWNDLINLNVTAASGLKRGMSSGSGQTALPASITFSSTGHSGGGPFWFGVG